MRKSKLFRIVLSLALVFAFVVPAVPASAAARELPLNVDALASGTKLVSKTDYAVTADVEESYFILNNETGSRQNICYALTVKAGGDAKVIASYKNQDPGNPGLQTMIDQAAAAEDKFGVNVVGGVNADFFVMKDEEGGRKAGTTLGYFIHDGVKYFDSNPGWSYFGITKTGEPVLRLWNVPTDDMQEAVGLNVVFVQTSTKSAPARGKSPSRSAAAHTPARSRTRSPSAVKSPASPAPSTCRTSSSA